MDLENQLRVLRLNKAFATPPTLFAIPQRLDRMFLKWTKPQRLASKAIWDAPHISCSDLPDFYYI
jgi:hypothetical protein